ncbi:aldo/keto reductase [Amycolatopsis thermophila]|uniref:Aryl-alcohol dehydrogenase-like predicted oxidoreductase n=1 Tax=Amycolatopsis thermophila TaxID=206084 RepID=A0ABU0EXC8_9PSEU|nr:aldo/keto reductase [Amycolatopsis thermophila]MDQ0379947.1 aryl-alcohol dehydrogenase-like predicted oxidoreductase [Amycolatopsis thermophila]
MGTARITLGHSDIRIRPIGLGCMGMSQFYGPADEDESVATIHAALDAGVDFFDTSDVYGAAGAATGQEQRGFGHNERLLGRAVRDRRDEVVIGTKFGARPTGNGIEIDGRPEYVKQACDASLRRLGIDHIDVYYAHRLDERVPVEETVGAMAELVEAGKVRVLGLSNVGADILRRASAVAPISALQSEYSLWERGIEREVLPACRELGITVVPFSPLGRAALAGTFSAGTSFPADDFRATLPKFRAENFAENLRLVEALKEFSEARGHTPGQVALAWLLAQPHDIAPIPGTKRAKYVRENVAATGVPLSADDLAELAGLFAPDRVRGGQYGDLAVLPRR